MMMMDRWNSKMLMLSTSVDQKKLETEFSKSKTMFLAIFYQHPLTVKSFFDCGLSGVIIVCKYRFIQRCLRCIFPMQFCHIEYI